MGKFDVVGIGAYCIDFLVVMDKFPSEDEKHEVREMYMEGGGNVATACVTVARLGGHVAYHGPIGNDFLSGSVIEGFKNEGVDTNWVTYEKGITPFSFIIINKEYNTRTIMFRKKGVPEFQAVNVNEELVKNSNVLLIDFYHPYASLKASEIATENNVKVVLDAESIQPLSKRIVSNVTHLICSRTFAINYTGVNCNERDETLLQRLAGMLKCEVVGITLGEKGSIFYERKSGEIIHQKSYTVEVVDTTGAGDVFHGAFCFFLSKGYPLNEIIRYASACASLSCRSVGGRSGIPTYDELVKYLK